jgi:hypothetical protein
MTLVLIAVMCIGKLELLRRENYTAVTWIIGLQLCCAGEWAVQNWPLDHNTNSCSRVMVHHFALKECVLCFGKWRLFHLFTGLVSGYYHFDLSHAVGLLVSQCRDSSHVSYYHFDLSRTVVCLSASVVIVLMFHITISV